MTQLAVLSLLEVVREYAADPDLNYLLVLAHLLAETVHHDPLPLSW